MSELNELIASSTVRAFNAGFAQGRLDVYTREEIQAAIKAVESCNEIGDLVYVADFWEVLEEGKSARAR